VGGPTARTGRVLRMGLSIHRAHLRRNLAPMIPPSTTQGSDYQLVLEEDKKPRVGLVLFSPVDLVSDGLPDEQAHHISQKHKSNPLLQVF
jgi:hypothetical protein